MLRRLKWRGIASRVTESGAECEAIVKQVRHLPRRHADIKALATNRLANLETVRFIDPDVPANLRVQSRIAKRLDTRAVEKHVPAVEFFRCRDECERRVSQLRRTALRV